MDELERIQAYYEKAAGMATDQQIEYLKELENQDFELSREVRSLLDVDNQDLLIPDQGLLGEPLLEGKRLGAYVIEREVGQGGAGRVYLARQNEPVEREVAIKIMSYWGLNEVAKKRFEFERAVLARMRHSCIAHFFEAGFTAEGQPFIVMEYLDGESLIDYVTERQLNLEERVALFIHICSGVTHAHQKGVLHRDIKPGNIVVVEENSKPIPKLIDFGIARSMEDDYLTRTGQAPGTWSYMSPEQMDPTLGDQDVRTDIYALGATLFHVLVGAPPHGEIKGQMSPRLIRKICEQSPERPSRFWLNQSPETRRFRADHMRESSDTITKALERDLDWIVMKALARESERRYHSVTELANDLQRYLEGKPVVAGPPTRRYVWGKFIARNRAMVSLTAAALILVLTFSAVTIRQWRIADHQRALALAEAETSQRVLGFIRETFRELDPYDGGGRSVTARQILDSAAIKIRSELAQEPGAQARLMTIVGEIYTSYGALPESRGLLEDAITYQHQHPVGENHLSETLEAMALLNLEDGHLEEAEALGERVLELSRSRKDADAGAEGNALALMGRLVLRQDRYSDAIKYLEQARAIFTANGNVPALVSVMERLGYAHFRLNDLDEADRFLNEAQEMGETSQVAHSLINDILHTRSSVASARSDFDQAIALQEEVIARDREIFGDDYHNIAMSMSSISQALLGKGMIKEAEARIHAALKHLEGVVDDDHPLVAIILNDLGNIMMQSRRGDEAVPILLRALDIRKKILGEMHIETAVTHQVLGLAYASLSDARARQHLEKSYQIHLRYYDAGHPYVCMVVHAMAYESWKSGDLETAESDFAALKEMMLDNYGLEHTYVAAVFHDHARLLVDRKQSDRAIEMFLQSIAIRRKLGENDHPRLADSLYRLARIYNDQAAFHKAEPLALEAVAIYEEAEVEIERINATKEILAASRQGLAEQ